MHFNIDHIRKNDPEVAQAIDAELDRQQTGLEMIASENFTSRAVMEANTLNNVSIASLKEVI